MTDTEQDHPTPESTLPSNPEAAPNQPASGDGEDAEPHWDNDWDGMA